MHETVVRAQKNEIRKGEKRDPALLLIPSHHHHHKKILIKQQQQNTKHYHHYHVEILHDDRDHETIDRRLFSNGASCRAPRVAFFN